MIVAPGALDADRFESGYRRARRLLDAEPDAAVRELESALALWRGPAYGEFATGFAQAPSVRLAELRTAAAEDLVELLIRTGAATDAVAAARELVGDAPAARTPRRAADACSARRAEGWRTPWRPIAQHRQLLADELGLDPPAGPA